MRRRQFLKAAAALAAPTGGFMSAARAAPPTLTALVGGQLIDGYGGPPLEDSVVLLSDDRISAIGTLDGFEIPAEANLISTEGCTVLPGLWDMNVHLTRLGHADTAHWDELYLPLAERVVMPLAAAQLLNAGVTSVRDVGSPLAVSVAARERVKGLRQAGPTVYAGGPYLTHAALERQRGYKLALDGVAEARATAQATLRAGADLLLVAAPAALSGDELAAIVQSAHAAQSSVHAEVGSDADLVAALKAGVDGLIGVGDAAGPLSAEVESALAARLGLGRPLIVASTLSPLVNYQWLCLDHEPLDDPRWREGWPEVIASDVRSSIGDGSPLAPSYPYAEARRAALGARVRAFLDAGALLVVGSGAGEPGHLPGRATWQEIEALVREAGLAPMEAIRRATYWCAVAAGVQHESGTVTAGKYADLISVRGDVLRHIDRLADVEVVIRRGMRQR